MCEKTGLSWASLAQDAARHLRACETAISTGHRPTIHAALLADWPRAREMTVITLHMHRWSFSGVARPAITDDVGLLNHESSLTTKQRLVRNPRFIFEQVFDVG